MPTALVYGGMLNRKTELIMKKNIIHYALMMTLGAATLLTACDNEPETLNYSVTTPQEENSELYARYTASLREYKLSEHTLVMARLDNAPEVSTSEKDFMRSLPDSLDLVVLTRADRFTAYDREDMKMLQQVKGTRVLYGVNLNGEDAGAALDKALTAIAAEGFDGMALAFEGDLATAGELQQLVQQKVLANKERIGLLVFEGTPLFFDAAGRNTPDYYVLDSRTAQDGASVARMVDAAVGFAGVPRNKLFVSTSPEGTILNEQNVKSEAMPVIARTTIETGIAGMSVYDIGTDYYGNPKNYLRTCAAIQLLNPSPTH